MTEQIKAALMGDLDAAASTTALGIVKMQALIAGLVRRTVPASCVMELANGSGAEPQTTNNHRGKLLKCARLPDQEELYENISSMRGIAGSNN